MRKPNIYLQIGLPFRGIVQQQKQSEVFDMYHPILNHLWCIYQHRFFPSAFPQFLLQTQPFARIMLGCPEKAGTSVSPARDSGGSLAGLFLCSPLTIPSPLEKYSSGRNPRYILSQASCYTVCTYIHTYIYIHT